jgi:hypothetical protein
MLVLTAVFLLTPLSAKADAVVFSTAACFASGCTPGGFAATTITSTVTGGSYSLSYTVAGPTTVDASPLTFQSLGYFQLAVTGIPQPSAALDGIGFALQVMQSLPSTGSDIFSATLFGRFQFNGSQAYAVFGNSSFALGSVTYSLLNLDGGNTLYLAGLPGGRSDVTAKVEVAPEPPTLALVAAGLMGIGLLTKKLRLA